GGRRRTPCRAPPASPGGRGRAASRDSRAQGRDRPAQLGKADPGDAEDLLAACDPFRAFELDAEQQFAPLAERPGIAELAVFRFRDAPDRRRARFRAAAARAETERLCLAGVGAVPVRTTLAAHALDRARQ